MVQFFNTPAEAVADIPDGVTIAAHIWGLSATPSQLILAIRDRGIKDITLVTPNITRAPAYADQIPGAFDILQQCKKVITNFVGYRAGGYGKTDDFLADRVENGDLTLEVHGHGNWMLRLAAGAARLGGFYTPIGVGTEVEEGLEVREIDGQKYILLTPIRPDVGLVRALRADKLGNLIYYGTERASAPILAQASKLTIAEVEEIVEVGELDPEEIVTPHIFVDRVVKISEGSMGSRSQKNELIAKLAQHEAAQKRYFAVPSAPEGSNADKLAGKERLTQDVIAMRAARELKPGDTVNLGLGIPQIIATYVPPDVFFHCENGCLGYGPLVNVDEVAEKAEYGLVDAGGHFFTRAPGMSFFDMLTSFNMLRSGRVVSMVGALEVSEKGDIANHSLGAHDKYSQIGGAMDVAWGGKRIIVCMTHTTRENKPRILKECRLPITVRGKLNLIITDIAVMEVTPTGLLLKELAPGWTAEEVQTLTEAELTVAPDLAEMTL